MPVPKAGGQESAQQDYSALAFEKERNVTFGTDSATSLIAHLIDRGKIITLTASLNASFYNLVGPKPLLHPRPKRNLSQTILHESCLSVDFCREIGISV
jgi:hypothetical protein